jgi:hypothetical protein
MTTTAAATSPRASLLVTALTLDAAMSGAAGALLVAGGAFLDGATGIPAAWLLGIGLFFLAYAAVLVAVVRAGTPPRLARLVVLGNAGWVVLSVVALLADWLTPTTTGAVLIGVQAAAVALVAELQWLGGRRGGGQSTSL